MVKSDENVGKVGQVVFEGRRPMINDVCDINHRTKISTEGLKIITTKFILMFFRPCIIVYNYFIYQL